MGLFSWISRQCETGRIEAQNSAQQHRDHEAAKQRGSEARAEWSNELADRADAARARGDHNIADIIEDKMDRLGL